MYRLISSPLVTWQGGHYTPTIWLYGDGTELIKMDVLILWHLGVYSDGDFMVHLAGLDEKKKWFEVILDQLRASE